MKKDFLFGRGPIQHLYVPEKQPLRLWGHCENKISLQYQASNIVTVQGLHLGEGEEEGGGGKKASKQWHVIYSDYYNSFFN